MFNPLFFSVESQLKHGDCVDRSQSRQSTFFEGRPVILRSQGQKGQGTPHNCTHSVN